MILDRILEATAARVATLPEDLTMAGHRGPYPCSLLDAVTRPGEGSRIIAEIKYSSPSRGVISPAGDPVDLATRFARAGACALSVITEPVFFRGRADFIPRIRPFIDIPLLRKDFIVDERQLSETRMLGADAVLLIGYVLGERLGEFVDLAFRHGLEPLVEVHTMDEVRAALDTRARLIGINNRDLKTFSIDLSTTMRLAPAVREAGRTVVAESGIVWPCDIRTLRPYAEGFLVGGAVMGARDPVRRLEGLISA